MAETLPLVPTFEENVWVIARRAPDVPGQWLARCLNLDILCFGASLERALAALARTVSVCLAAGPHSAPRPHRKVPEAERALLERLVREGTHGEPPDRIDIIAGAQLHLVSHAGSSHVDVRRLPAVWVEERPTSARHWPFAANHATHRARQKCGHASNSSLAYKGLAMSSAPNIIITTQDFERLQCVVSCSDSTAAEQLDAELARARLVPQTDVPEDVVTMNSNVVYEDAASGARRTIRVVYPKDAAAARGWVSVLAPVGSALLGLRQGQEINWPTPGGNRRLRVVAVPYQPERHGDFAL